MVDEFRELYSAFQQPEAALDTIDLHVARRSRFGSIRSRYDVCGDGETLFAARRAREVLPYVEWAINWRVIATHTEFLQLHAAALVRGDHAVVFPGASGSGKSTLVAGLLKRGWKYLSDEFALIHLDTGLVHAFPKAVCIKAGSFGVLGKLNLPIWRRRNYVKAFKGPVGYLRSQDLDPDVVGRRSPIGRIILPRYVPGADPFVRSIPRSEMAFALNRHVLNRDQIGPRGWSWLTDTVRVAQCFRLVSGELQATCDLVESLFP